MKRIFHVFVLCCLVDMSLGNGRLMNPPMRSTLWRLGYDAPRNYDDHTLDCGGLERQYNKNGGKCGVCGDPWDGTRENEAGGKYAPTTPIIPRHYTVGSDVKMTVKMLAPRGGYFEFRLCRVEAPEVPVTQECLDQHLLEIVNGTGSRVPVPLAGEAEEQLGLYDVTVRLPQDVTCSQCVVQWKYHAGNEWGTDPSGKECLGCGPQFEQYNCADVAILKSGENNFHDVDPVDRGNSDPLVSPGNSGVGEHTLGLPTVSVGNETTDTMLNDSTSWEMTDSPPSDHDTPVVTLGNINEEPNEPPPSNHPQVGPPHNEEPTGSGPFDHTPAGPSHNGAEGSTDPLTSNNGNVGPHANVNDEPTATGQFDHTGVGPVDNGGVTSTESGPSGRAGVFPPDDTTSGLDGISNHDLHSLVDPIIADDPMQDMSPGIGDLPDLQAHKFAHRTNEYETSVIVPEEVEASGSTHSSGYLYDVSDSGSHGIKDVRSKDYTPGWLGSYSSSYLPMAWRPIMEIPTWHRPQVQTNIWVTNTWRQPSNMWGAMNAMNTNSLYSHYLSPRNTAGNVWNSWNAWPQPQNQWAFNRGSSIGWNNRPRMTPRNTVNNWWSEPRNAWGSMGHPNQQRLRCPSNQRFVCRGMGQALQGFVTEQYCYQNCGLGMTCPQVCSCTCVDQFSLDCKYMHSSGTADISENEWCNRTCNGGVCPVGYCDCQTVQNW